MQYLLLKMNEDCPSVIFTRDGTELQKSDSDFKLSEVGGCLDLEFEFRPVSDNCLLTFLFFIFVVTNQANVALILKCSEHGLIHVPQRYPIDFKGAPCRFMGLPVDRIGCRIKAPH